MRLSTQEGGPLMSMRTYFAVAVNIIGRSVTAMETHALQWKGDRTAMQRRHDCSGKPPRLQWKNKGDSRPQEGQVLQRKSHKVFGGVLYSGSEW
jgi:hypothetical protein